MKSLQAILFLIVGCALMIGCPKETVVVEKPVVVERQVDKPLVTPDGKQVPAESIPLQPTLNEDKPSPKVAVQDDPKGLIKEESVAEEEHLKKVQTSQDEVSMAPDLDKNTNMITLHLRFFNDPAILDQVYNRILQTGFNNNFQIKNETRPNRKEIKLKIVSQLSPASFQQTIENTLIEYAVRVMPQSERHYIVIEPN